MRRTSLAASSLWVRTKASADEKSRPPTRAKSMMRKRIGLFSQTRWSRRFLISSSTTLIVPKKTGVRRARGVELTESLELHDVGLRADRLDKGSLGAWATDRRLCRRAAKDGTNGTPARALNDEEDTRQDDADEKTNDKVKDGHANGDDPDRDVLHSVDTVPGVPDGLDDEIDTEDVDESTDNHDRWWLVRAQGSVLTKVADYRRPNKHDARCRSSQHDTRESGSATDTVDWGQRRNGVGTYRAHC